MTPLALLREIQRRDRLLSATGWLHLALLAAMALLAAVDPRSVLGLNTWVKPMKFAGSIAVYCWTIAFLLGWLRPGRARSLVSRGTALCMIVEMACTGLQGARATRSHFNDAAPFDALLFGIMGLTILANMLLGALLLLQFFVQAVELPPALLWGVRLGLLLFLAGSGEGWVMIARRAHSVGLADGGPGLPLVNWSTRGGDLRAAHLVGLHALQAIPLAAWLLTRLRAGLSAAAQAGAVAGFALAYLALVVALFVQALAGRPVLAL